ncbi:Gfo/Idh/MocA family protein [Cohnella fermenti]|uniref:Gfo/Idh/MocA family oxidoreductase n=1 Tax=Cohnella fermenti TaxID=2565925 RepID=A0A4V3WDS9_9BACL|nr:Gfo/Idh/MocA family oxidoreductase [Cohnella fermenti]THF73410.1 Gfo/Idh/MocA family oxidoreductase [Cohnella fermenti]
MNSRKINFAVVGCGAISEAHLAGIASIDEAVLAAVCDLNEERARQKSDRYGGTVYTNYEDLLRYSDIDVVCLCTPSGLHPEQTILAAQAGKHVICEKPIALQLDDVDRMIDACRRSGVKLSTVFPRRMSPTSRYVKALLEEGRLGKLSLCSGHVKFYRGQAYYDSAGWRGTWEMDGGGAMMNQGIHTVDLLQWLAGPVQSLSGYARNVLRSIEVEDTAVAALQFRSGALGILEATTTAYKQPDHQIVIQGDRGTVVLEGDAIRKLEIMGEDVQLPEFEAFEVIPDGHRLLIRDMALAVLEDREPLIDGEAGRHALEIILGTYRSERTRQEVAL